MNFAEEIRNALKGLASDRRWQIVELLQEFDKLAYTELLDSLEIQKGSLNHHLTVLMEAGIIDNYPEEGFVSKYNSYYKLSRFGEDLISGILSSVETTISPNIQNTEKKEETKDNSVPLNRKDLEPSNFTSTPKQLPLITRHYLIYPNYRKSRRTPNFDNIQIKQSVIKCQ